MLLLIRNLLDNDKIDVPYFLSTTKINHTNVEMIL